MLGMDFGDKGISAASAAEELGRPSGLVSPGRLRRVDVHPADGVGGPSRPPEGGQMLAGAAGSGLRFDGGLRVHGDLLQMETLESAGDYSLPWATAARVRSRTCKRYATFSIGSIPTRTPPRRTGMLRLPLSCSRSKAESRASVSLTDGTVRAMTDDTGTLASPSTAPRRTSARPTIPTSASPSTTGTSSWNPASI